MLAVGPDLASFAGSEAWWVVVQIIEQSGEGGSECKEAALMQGLSHPNIVVTHKVACRTRTVSPSALA